MSIAEPIELEHLDVGAVPSRIDLRRLSPGDAARVVEIGLTFARHGVIVLARRGPFLVIKPRHQAPRALAVALRRSFVDLGPAFIKFGQVVASSPGLFPDTLSVEFRRLLDAVPAESTRTVRAIIERSLGGSIDDLFDSFEDQPVASASIAQVHEARLRDGTRVAIKVRRPRLHGRIDRDLRLLRLLAAGLERTGSTARILNPAAIVEDFAATLRDELDFRNEAASMRAFTENLRGFGTNDTVIVPEPIDGMITERVLVMTFVDGTCVDDAAALHAAGLDAEDLLRRGVRAWLESALEHGLFHGDVHAGNLLVTPTGDLAMLDFGIVGRLDDHTRRVLRGALPALLIEGDFTRVVHAFFDLGATTGPVDVEEAARDVEALVKPLLLQPLARDRLRRDPRPHPARCRPPPSAPAARARPGRQAASLLRALCQGARTRLHDPVGPGSRRSPARRRHLPTEARAATEAVDTTTGP